MRSWVSYRFQIDFDVYVWTSENDAKTLGVDANFFENEKKKLRFQTNTVFYKLLIGPQPTFAECIVIFL